MVQVSFFTLCKSKTFFKFFRFSRLISLKCLNYNSLSFSTHRIKTSLYNTAVSSCPPVPGIPRVLKFPIPAPKHFIVCCTASAWICFQMYLPKFPLKRQAEHFAMLLFRDYRCLDKCTFANDRTYAKQSFKKSS